MNNQMNKKGDANKGRRPEETGRKSDYKPPKVYHIASWARQREEFLRKSDYEPKETGRSYSRKNDFQSAKAKASKNVVITIRRREETGRRADFDYEPPKLYCAASWGLRPNWPRKRDDHKQREKSGNSKIPKYFKPGWQNK